MTVIPLVFSLLITGIASTSASTAAGGLAARSMLLFTAVLFGAAFFGEAVVAGFLALWPIPAGAAEALRASVQSSSTVVPAVAPLSEWLGALIPTNPIKAAADGEMLPLVLFALMSSTR
jgi:Na+/H+-dicarboxylate symporter